MTSDDLAKEFTRERDALRTRLQDLADALSAASCDTAGWDPQPAPRTLADHPPLVEILHAFDRAYTLGIKFAVASLEQAAERGTGVFKRPEQE